MVNFVLLALLLASLNRFRLCWAPDRVRTEGWSRRRMRIRAQMKVVGEVVERKCGMRLRWRHHFTKVSLWMKLEHVNWLANNGINGIEVFGFSINFFIGHNHLLCYRCIDRYALTCWSVLPVFMYWCICADLLLSVDVLLCVERWCVLMCWIYCSV